jgi:polyferredoxin
MSHHFTAWTVLSWTVLAFTAWAFIVVVIAILRGAWLVWRALQGLWRRFRQERARKRAMPKRERVHLSRKQRRAWRKLSAGPQAQQAKASPKGEQR